VKQYFHKRLLLKWCAVAFAALALAYGVRIASELSNDVHLTYHAPAGKLRVTVFDHTDKRIRQTHFSTGEFTHRMVLPNGTYRVELVPAGRVPYAEQFHVKGDVSLAFTYPLKTR
jgi:hypothetical protein